MKIGVYSRVSTSNQDTASQMLEVREWINKRYHNSDYTVYEDIASGTRDNRPALQRLKRDIDAGLIDTVVVYRLDRLSRKSVTALQLLLDWLQRGIGFISVSQPVLQLGVDNPFRLTFAAMFAELAQLERQAIVERVRSGLKAAKARGVKLGAESKLTPEQQEQVRAARKRGQTCRTLAREYGVSAATISRT